MLTFTESDMQEDKKKIENKISEYITLIENEYGLYMNYRNRDYLENNKNRLVEFNEEKTITFFVSNGKLFLPTVAYEIFSVLMKHPNYSSNLGNRVREENYLDTNTTYDDYIKHVIEAGLTPYDYFEESLLHETMHLCGSGGKIPLEEGINELKTRELAQKYHIKIAAMGYPKEVEVAKQLQDIIGRDTMSEIAFLNPRMAIDLIRKTNGVEVANLYQDIRNCMIEQSKNYNDKIHEIANPIEKARVYSKIDYSKTQLLISEYKSINQSCKNNV